jgi:hypothetical protein
MGYFYVLRGALAGHPLQTLNKDLSAGYCELCNEAQHHTARPLATSLSSKFKENSENNCRGPQALPRSRAYRYPSQLKPKGS